jgi:hypothetical protein
MFGGMGARHYSVLLVPPPNLGKAQEMNQQDGGIDFSTQSRTRSSNGCVLDRRNGFGGVTTF